MEFLHKDREQFLEAIYLAEHQTGIMAQVIEKDYYVTMILRLLADRASYIVFKGGTSLSKCYKVIKRFSEDIDITVDTSLSQGEKKKLKKIIVDIVEELGLQIANLEETRSSRNYNKYIIVYDTVLPMLGEALQPEVLIETSYMTVSIPTVVLPVSSYIGEMMITEAPDLLQAYALEAFEMKVQCIDRTLVDKVFAVCDYYLNNLVRKHSRHIYDIYKLLPLVQLDDEFKNLVAEVREVRKTSLKCPSAQDGVNIREVLQTIIKEEIYKADYQEITEKFLEEQIPYQVAIGALKKIAGRW